MTILKHAGNFRELLVYQKARELQREIFQLTRSFPRDESFSLTSQIRRSSRSIGANIAEAWAKRRYDKHFISKLTDADGEQYETQHWIETTLDCGYWDAQKAKGLTAKCMEIGKLLGGMMEKADIFCGEPPRMLREAPLEYFLTTEDSNQIC